MNINNQIKNNMCHFCDHSYHEKIDLMYNKEFRIVCPLDSFSYENIIDKFFCYYFQYNYCSYMKENYVVYVYNESSLESTDTLFVDRPVLIDSKSLFLEGINI